LKSHVMSCLAGEKWWKIRKMAAAEKMWLSVKKYDSLLLLSMNNLPLYVSINVYAIYCLNNALI
jgi:hypothetical protein